MATVADFLQRAQRESGDLRPDPLIAIQWLQDRYHSVLKRVNFQFRIKEAIFSTTDEFTTGDVDLTNDSATITEGTSGANGWSTSLEGSYFRVSGDSEFYLLSSYSNANPDTLQLDRVYEGTTATASSYKIFPRFYALASDVGEVVSISKLKNAQYLQRTEQSELDRSHPNRSRVGEPSVWAYAGIDSSGVQQVELYPIANEAKGYMYRYIQSVPTLDSGDDTIIAEVPFNVLVAGWQADYWMWRATLKSANGSEGPMSDRFESKFEIRMKELVLQEIGKTPRGKLRLSRRFTRHRWDRSKGAKYVVVDGDN